MKAIFLDINIILDIFLERAPFYLASGQVFKLVEKKQFEGFLCAVSYPTLFYILRKEQNRDKAKEILKKVRIVLKTAPVIEKVIDSALNTDMKDFEDAIQYYSALEVTSDYFITRNKKDFPEGILPVLTPAEFLALLESGNSGQKI